MDNHKLLEPLHVLLREYSHLGGDETIINNALDVLSNLSCCRIVDLSPEVVVLLGHLLSSEFNKSRSHESLALQAIDELQLDDELLSELTEIHEDETELFTEEDEEELNITNYKEHL